MDLIQKSAINYKLQSSNKVQKQKDRIRFVL